MKIRVSDFVIQRLKYLGIENVFCVTGGPAAHLLEATRNSNLEVIHNHHEQACAMAADAYARIKKKPALVLLTNGPGVSNALTGVLGAYQDSIPMIVLSGQVPTKQTMGKSTQHVRQIGVQEVNTVPLVSSITKFAKQLSVAAEVPLEIDKAWRLATTGRMGPVWLEIPLNIQAEEIDADPEEPLEVPKAEQDMAFLKTKCEEVLRAIAHAKYPLIIAGSGIHLSNSEKPFRELVQRLEVPVVSTWSASDLFAADENLYMGNFGILGQRAANLAVQHSDLLLIIGSRLSIPNIGYATDLFAPTAKKIMVDIDEAELNKETISIDIKILSDVGVFLEGMLGQETAPRVVNTAWLKVLAKWKSELDLASEAHVREEDRINSYDFVKALSHALPDDSVVVTDMGTSFTCTMQALQNNGRNRLFTSSGTSSMGFGLPGALGAYMANKASSVICIAGDGGFQMNLQELQTIVHYQIPIKIFILNSEGYLAISIMQENLFEGKYFGSTPSSGVSAPDFVKVAQAFGLNARRLTCLEDLTEQKIREILATPVPMLCEILLPRGQVMMPRVQSMKTDDGKIFSNSIEYMWPFLDNEMAQEISKDLEMLEE